MVLAFEVPSEDVEITLGCPNCGCWLSSRYTPDAPPEWETVTVYSVEEANYLDAVNAYDDVHAFDVWTLEDHHCGCACFFDDSDQYDANVSYKDALGEASTAYECGRCSTQHSDLDDARNCCK